MCPCPSPKGWTWADQEEFAPSALLPSVAPCRDAICFRECCAAGEVPCKECVSESAWFCRCFQMPNSASVCAFLPSSRICCRSMVPYRCGRCVSAPRSGPRAERACPYPSPREWYRACCCGAMGDISVWPFGCCSIASVAAWWSCCFSVICSGPKADQACTYPSPRGWYREGRRRVMTCGAGCVSGIVCVAVEPQPPVGAAVVAPYQAQV